MFRTHSPYARCAGVVTAVAFLLIGPTAYSAPPVVPSPAIFDKDLPESIEDLRAIQERVREILEKVIPATVNVRVGASQGSGVIIRDNYILTAGHVSGKPGARVSITLHDGKTVSGETLGRNTGIDSGLIRITTPGEFPQVEMGTSADLGKGAWVIATGHPGGYRVGRAPVVRVGRVVDNRSSAIRTDCSLVGGDSGGPLFDLDGKVVGIHSRIGGSITANHHVPIDTYTSTWDRLVKGDDWGRSLGFGPSEPDGDADNQPYYGIQFDPASEELRILQVLEGGPADKAGLKADDVVLKFDDKNVNALTELRTLIRSKKPGDTVDFQIRRGDETLSVRLKVGVRPG